MPTKYKQLKPLNPIWTIWVPLFISILIILFIASITVSSAATENAGIHQWGAISLIFVIIPFLLVGIVILLIISLLCVGIYTLTKSMQGWLNTGQSLVYSVCFRILMFSDSLAKATISQRSWGAGINKLIGMLFHKKFRL